LRVAAAVFFAATGLRAAVVVRFAAARTGVLTVLATDLLVFAAGFAALAAGLRALAVFVAAVAARFAGARRVDARTAIALARGAEPVSAVLSLLTASLLLSR
jgi:hypothetical protein